MYAEDNRNYFPQNSSGDPHPSWVEAEWTGLWEQDNTNVQKILKAQLGPYTRNAQLYQCPPTISRSALPPVFRPCAFAASP